MSYAGIFTDKNNIDHPITSTLYGTCSTAAATAAKEVVCSNVDSLEAGMTLRVVFTNANTAASPTINVNSKGAKNVYRFGSTTPIGGNSWEAGAVVDLFYDGTSFFMLNSDDIGSVKRAIDAIKDGQSIDSFGDVETALAGKQATLTFDNVPTDGSNNPVKSDGIYDALATKANQAQLATVEASTTASKAYSANEYLVLGGVLYKVTANIAQGGTIVTEGAGKNVNLATVGGELNAINSKFTDLVKTYTADNVTFSANGNAGTTIPITSKVLSVLIDPDATSSIVGSAYKAVGDGGYIYGVHAFRANSTEDLFTGTANVTVYYI